MPAIVHAGDLLIRNARLIDGTGAPPRTGMAILVHDGRIIAIRPDVDAVGIPVIDAAGATVLPGLIDAHMHMAAAPGSAFRGDSVETIQQLNRQHLRAYLASGVTTVLDPGTPLELVEGAQRTLAAGNPGPRYLTTGPMMRSPGGYGAEAHGAVHNPAEVEAMLDRLVELGAIGVKLSTEQGIGMSDAIPVYPPEIRTAIVEGAKRRRLPLFVHAMNERDATIALDMGAHAIMHSPLGGAWTGQFFGVADLSPAFIERMKESGTSLVTTLSLVDTWSGHFDVARLDDPAVRLTVPEVELATARDPAAASAFAVSILGFGAPWTFEFTRPWVAYFLWSRENLEDGLRYSQRNVLALHRAGVRIVAGTDAPSPWPEAIYNFHGVQTPREVELIGGAGLTPIEAIQAATIQSARMLGVDGEIGTVEVGKRADLVIVVGDPLADLRALRDVRWTVRDGIARTPAEWMESKIR